jgi:hypothetical protein
LRARERPRDQIIGGIAAPTEHFAAVCLLSSRSGQNKFGGNALSCHAQKQTRNCRPDENATRSVWRGIANAAFDAGGWGRRDKSEAGETTPSAAGSGSRGKSENKPAQVTSETAGRAKDQTELVSGVVFPVEILQVGQSLHGQAVLVFFAFDVALHQMPGKPFAGALRLGTVCKSAIDSQRAINGQYIHLDSRGWFEQLHWVSWTAPYRSPENRLICLDASLAWACLARNQSPPRGICASQIRTTC